MKETVFKSLRGVTAVFLAGLLAILPLVLTIAIVIWVSSFVQQFLGRDTIIGRGLEGVGLSVLSKGEEPNRILGYMIGWAFVLGAVFLLGLLVQLGAKRFLQRAVDAVLTRIPIIGNVYGTSRQLVDMFDRKSPAEMKAMSVVFCVFGKDGAGVLALMPTPKKFTIAGQQYHVVIIPTAPVPFGGGLLFMPVDSVKAADMSVDGLMSIYVSMGVTTGQFISETKTDSDSQP